MFTLETYTGSFGEEGVYRLKLEYRERANLPSITFGPFKNESQSQDVANQLVRLLEAGVVIAQKDPQLPGLEVTAFGIPLWFAKCAWEDDPAHPSLTEALDLYREVLGYREGHQPLPTGQAAPFQRRASIIREDNDDICAGKYRCFTTRQVLRQEVLEELRVCRENGTLRVGVANWSTNEPTPSFAVRVVPTPRGAVEMYPSAKTLRQVLEDASLVRGYLGPFDSSQLKTRFDREFLI